MNKRPPLNFVLPNNDLFHYSFTIKKARHRLNVGQILFTIHLPSKRPGGGAWDFINGGGLLIRGGYIHTHILCTYLFHVIGTIIRQWPERNSSSVNMRLLIS